jgi:RsiW-degrading membrane proteinase PrsW (M82 family)
VYQQLHEKHTPVDWVIGTAIHGAVMAGSLVPKIFNQCFAKDNL